MKIFRPAGVTFRRDPGTTVSRSRASRLSRSRVLPSLLRRLVGEKADGSCPGEAALRAIIVHGRDRFGIVQHAGRQGYCRAAVVGQSHWRATPAAVRTCGDGGGPEFAGHSRPIDVGTIEPDQSGEGRARPAAAHAAMAVMYLPRPAAGAPAYSTAETTAGQHRLPWAEGQRLVMRRSCNERP